MRTLLLWLFVIGAVAFFWNRSHQPASQHGRTQRTENHAREAARGGPAGQWERAPRDLMEGQAALPQAGGGVAPGAMVNAVRQGLNGGDR